MKRKQKSWYGVRTLYRIEALGKPKHVDEDCDPEATLVEDRVVLFHAIDFENALEQAEKEAKAYSKASVSYRNRYGQKLRMRYLKISDAYRIEGGLVAGCELYSTTEIVPSSIPDREVIAARISDSNRQEPVRIKFIADHIARWLTEPAPAASAPPSGSSKRARH